MENANKDIMDALQYIMANMVTKDELKNETSGAETRLKVFVESNVTKRLDSLTDGYKSVHEKQWELERQNEKLMALMNELQNRVAILEDKTA